MGIYMLKLVRELPFPNNGYRAQTCRAPNRAAARQYFLACIGPKRKRLPAGAAITEWRV